MPAPSPRPCYSDPQFQHLFGQRVYFAKGVSVTHADAVDYCDSLGNAMLAVVKMESEYNFLPMWHCKVLAYY